MKEIFANKILLNDASNARSWFFRKIAKSDRYLRHICPSFRLSASVSPQGTKPRLPMDGFS